MSVKRFDCEDYCDGGIMNERAEGDYVEYKDYAVLEARCAALAAENAALMKFCKNSAFDEDYEAELGMERGGFTDALNDIKTPSTDAFLADVRAQGVDGAVETIMIHMNHQHHAIGTAINILRTHAAQLRQETK